MNDKIDYTLITAAIDTCHLCSVGFCVMWWGEPQTNKLLLCVLGMIFSPPSCVLSVFVNLFIYEAYSVSFDLFLFIEWVRLRWVFRTKFISSSSLAAGMTACPKIHHIRSRSQFTHTHKHPPMTNFKIIFTFAGSEFPSVPFSMPIRPTRRHISSDVSSANLPFENESTRIYDWKCWPKQWVEPLNINHL